MASTTMNASNNGGVALLLIDLQPEWYSQNDQIQSHFPDLPKNIKNYCKYAETITLKLFMYALCILKKIRVNGWMNL